MKNTVIHMNVLNLFLIFLMNLSSTGIFATELPTKNNNLVKAVAGKNFKKSVVGRILSSTKTYYLDNRNAYQKC